MKIEVINPVYCKVSVADIPLIKPCLKFQNSWYYRGKSIKTRDGKVRKVGGKTKFYDDYFIDKKTGVFLSGFLPRIFKYCKLKEIPYEVKGITLDPLQTLKKPSLPGITFKPFQLDLINKIKINNRGVIISPTGSGKTIIAMGIISMFPKARVLFLCHSIAILRQTQSNFLKYGFKSVSFVGSGEKDLSGQIVVASIKSMVGIPIGDYEDLFDIVIIDECFAKGTLVLTKKGNKPIERIKVGDIVKSKVKYRKVRKIYKNKVKLKNVCKVTLSNGKIIYCSKDHLFLTKNVWIKAKGLNKNSVLTYDY